jgi:hypothetical protein
MCSDKNNRDALSWKFLQKVESLCSPAHLNVEEENIWALRNDELQRLIHRGGFPDLFEADLGKGFLDAASCGWFVVNDEDIHLKK